jgi:hypothetical protein
MTFECFIMQEVADAVEDAAIEKRVSVSNQLTTYALNDVTLSDTRRPDKNRVVMFADEVSFGHVVDLFSLHRFIEVEVEIV